jgi:hypothetical protein
LTADRNIGQFELLSGTGEIIPDLLKLFVHSGSTPMV